MPNVVCIDDYRFEIANESLIGSFQIKLRGAIKMLTRLVEKFIQFISNIIAKFTKKRRYHPDDPTTTDLGHEPSHDEPAWDVIVNTYIVELNAHFKETAERLSRIVDCVANRDGCPDADSLDSATRTFELSVDRTHDRLVDAKQLIESNKGQILDDSYYFSITNILINIRTSSNVLLRELQNKYRDTGSFVPSADATEARSRRIIEERALNAAMSKFSRLVGEITNFIEIIDNTLR